MRSIEETVKQDDPDWATWNGLALPRGLVHKLEITARFKRILHEKVQERRARAEQFLAASKPSEPQSTPASPATSPMVEWGTESPAKSGPRMPVFGRAEVEAYASARGPNDDDLKKRKGELVKVMCQRGGDRKLATVPEDWRDRLDEFAAQFPNVEVFEYLRATFALAEHDDGVPRLAPLLLGGEPGVGKSFWARRFAEFLGSGFAVLPMDSMQTGAALAGSQEFWNNTKPGIVFDQLVDKDYANPVVLLEELDKTGGGGSWGDPRNALHQLFEPGTAREFRDLSVPAVALDASRVIWVATANEIEHIPKPLLSRMRQFEVKAPTHEQSRVLAGRIFAKLRDELRVPKTFADPPKPVIERVAALPPRRIRQVLQEALGRALYAERLHILEKDIRLPSEEPGETRRIGFM